MGNEKSRTRHVQKTSGVKQSFSFMGKIIIWEENDFDFIFSYRENCRRDRAAQWNDKIKKFTCLRCDYPVKEYRENEKERLRRISK